MAKKKHRGTSKIKYQHSMIQGLREWLESIESWPEIKSILPGKIVRGTRTSEFGVSVQYQTGTGIKCLVRGKSRVQEVFIVTSDSDTVEGRIKRLSSGAS